MEVLDEGAANHLFGDKFSVEMKDRLTARRVLRCPKNPRKEQQRKWRQQQQQQRPLEEKIKILERKKKFLKHFIWQKFIKRCELNLKNWCSRERERESWEPIDFESYYFFPSSLSSKLELCFSRPYESFISRAFLIKWHFW